MSLLKSYASAFLGVVIFAVAIDATTADEKKWTGSEDPNTSSALIAPSVSFTDYTLHGLLATLIPVKKTPTDHLGMYPDWTDGFDLHWSERLDCVLDEPRTLRCRLKKEEPKR